MANQYDITQKKSISVQNQNNKKKTNVPQAKSKKAPNSIMTSKQNDRKNELKALGLINNKGAGSKVKSKNGNVYTVIGQATNGRKIVQNDKGQIQVIAHDGTLLKKSYVQNTANKHQTKSPSQTTLNSLRKNLNTAKSSFKKQLEDDGWAGDLADGVSALWGSKNRASKVRVDIANEENRLMQLSAAAQKGDANFKAKFKQLYGVDYNQAAIDNYNKKPTAENYKKAYGSKYPDIRARVQNYNKSQQTGAEVVKTAAKVTTGVAVGIATGGTGFVAMGVAAGATTLASVAIEESDRYRITSGKGFRKGTNHKKIFKSALWDGASVLAGGAVGKVAATAVKGTTTAAKVGRAAINATGDVGVGAAQEYSETGHVTAQGVISNAAMSGVGSAVSSGLLKEAKAKFVRNFSKGKKATSTPKVATNKVTTNNNASKTKNIAPRQMYNENGEMLAGGSFFHKFSPSNLFGHSKTKLSPRDLMKQAENNISKQVKEGDPGSVHISRKLHDELSTPTIAKEFPSSIDLNSINSHIKSGEVCAVGSGTNQKLYVNNNGTAQEIQLSRETFDRLFPQGGFSMTSQKANNNCWILSRINAMTGSNTGKAELYSMFKELPNGDVQILLPNSNKPITFPNGKPLETNSARQIQEGGAPGVEMLQQAVQAKRIQKAEKTPVSNIEDCGIEKLNAQEGLQDFDTTATAMILDNKKFETARVNPDQYDKLENTLSSFNAREDMGTVTFENHARTLVDYNPQTKMVTYHNPYNGGVDITCPLEDLKKKFAHFAVSKSKQKTTTKNTVTQTVSDQVQNTVQQATTKPKARVELPNDKPVTRVENTTKNTEPQTVSAQTQATPMRKRAIPKPTENKTNIVRDNFREIAKTADGTPINAMISGNSVVINKNGKTLEISLSEIRENSFYKDSEVSLYSINETSTNSYIVIEADKYGVISTRSVKNDDEMYKLMDSFENKLAQQTTQTPKTRVNTQVEAKTSQTTSSMTEGSEIYRTGISKNDSMNTLVQRYSKEDKDLKNRLYDLDITMSQIEDSTIQKLINEELEDLAKNRSLSSLNFSHKIEDMQELVDAVNVRNGKYNINDIDSDNYFDRYHDFIKYASKDGKSLVKPNGDIDEKVLQDALGNINTYAADVVRDSFDARKVFVSNEKIKNIVANLKPDDKVWTVAKKRQMADLKYVKQDFKMANANTPLVTFLEHQPNSKAAPYLYDKYLSDLKTNGFSEEAISLCKNLSDKYNVRVFLSSQENPELALKEVTKELEKWHSVSAGRAKMPATINFSKINSMWFSIGEYGTRGGRAYSRMSENGGVCFKEQTAEAVRRSFRHEITHSNDTRMILNEDNLPDGYNYNEIFPEHSLGELPKVDNLKYADELRRAGISDKYISYAHTRPIELIAVASEGDMSTYSPEFKKVLVDFGMPKWLFNIDGKVANSSSRGINLTKSQQTTAQQITARPKMRVELDKPMTKPEVAQKRTSSPQLEIPQGFRDNGKILGKRSIIDDSGVVMIERNGAWKRLN